MPVDRQKCVKEMLGMGEVVERDLLVAYSVIDIHAIWVSVVYTQSTFQSNF